MTPHAVTAADTTSDGSRAELERARDEIARHVRLLAAMTVETEKARAEALELSRQLSRSNALMIAAISHDLRTPLNAVIGFSDVMQRELFGPLGHDRYRDYAVHIRESGEQLLKATERMLDQSRPVWAICPPTIGQLVEN